MQKVIRSLLFLIPVIKKFTSIKKIYIMKHKLFLAIIFCSITFSTLSAQTLTGDPWIFQAYKEMYNRQPNALEINIRNYNSGSWNNYGELKQYILQFQTSLLQSGITISTVFVKNVAVVGIRQNGQQVAVAALSLTGGQIVANDGATIVSGGAGNIVSGGAGILLVRMVPGLL